METKNEKDKALIQSCLDDRWYPVMKGEIAYYDTMCALCKEYDSALTNCAGCPIYFETGKPNCKGSPFYDWRHQANAGTLNVQCMHPEAQAMITFLEKLRDSL